MLVKDDRRYEPTHISPFEPILEIRSPRVYGAFPPSSARRSPKRSKI